MPVVYIENAITRQYCKSQTSSKQVSMRYAFDLADVKIYHEELELHRRTEGYDALMTALDFDFLKQGSEK
jgi:hypothetical protein